MEFRAVVFVVVCVTMRSSNEKDGMQWVDTQIKHIHRDYERVAFVVNCPES